MRHSLALDTSCGYAVAEGTRKRHFGASFFVD